MTPRSVNLASGTGTEGSDLENDPTLRESYTELGEVQEYSGDLLKSAYQVLKTRQRPPPKQYYFPISHKETKLVKLPPSLCKVCSSPKHWDKECPHWEAYLEQLKRKTALIASLQVSEESHPEDAYHIAYQVLMDEIYSNQIQSESKPSDFNIPIHLQGMR